MSHPRTKPVTLADLRAHEKGPGHVLLLCTKTGCEVSADPADYFMVGEDHVFKCCGRRMALVRKRTVYEDLLT